MNVDPIPFSPSPRSREIGELVASDAAVLHDAKVQGVAEEFFTRPHLEAVAVVDGRRPVGLLTRSRLLLKLARGFGHELYARKPVSRIADMAPLIVPATLSLEETIALSLDRAGAAVYDHLVVRNDAGDYVGLAPVREIVLAQSLAHARSAAEHQATLARAADLERLDLIRSQFLAHATHELRSPVNAMASLAETIRLACDRGDLAAVRERVELLLKSAAGLRGTVNNMLDLSKIEAGKVDLNCTRFALRLLLEELATTTRLLIGVRPVGVRVELRGAGELETDRAKLRQILLNLTSNAAKFTERGEIVLAAREDEAGIGIEVRDTGSGIRPEDLGRLFTPFGQLDDAQVKAREGTGLGLVIARSMANLLGGRIEVQSRRGQGSTFTLHLPRNIRRSEAA